MKRKYAKISVYVEWDVEEEPSNTDLMLALNHVDEAVAAATQALQDEGEIHASLTVTMNNDWEFDSYEEADDDENQAG